MALILDTENEIIIADDAGGMAHKLIDLLDDEPDYDTLIHLAAAVFGCDVLDVIITRAEES